MTVSSDVEVGGMTVSSDVLMGEGSRGNRVYCNLKGQVIFEMFIE